MFDLSVVNEKKFDWEEVGFSIFELLLGGVDEGVTDVQLDSIDLVGEVSIFGLEAVSIMARVDRKNNMNQSAVEGSLLRKSFKDIFWIWVRPVVSVPVPEKVSRGNLMM